MENTILAPVVIQPIAYTVNDTAIAQAKAAQEALLKTIPDNIEELDIEAVKVEKRKVVKLRTATDAERKAQKETALRYGQMVDSTAKILQEPISEIEKVYDDLIEQYDGHFKKLAEAAAEKEAQRILNIRTRINDILAYKNIPFNFTSTEIQQSIDELKSKLWEDSNFKYDEFHDEAEKNLEEVFAILDDALKSKLQFEAEQIQIATQRAIDEAARAKFEAEKAEFAEQQRIANAAIEAEKLALQKQKDEAERAEREKAEAEAQRLKAEAEAKQKEENDKRIAEERAKIAQEQEALRLQQIKAQQEAEARKLAQEKEDRVRNAAPALLNALIKAVKVIEDNVPQNHEFKYFYDVISLATGE